MMMMKMMMMMVVVVMVMMIMIIIMMMIVVVAMAMRGFTLAGRGPLELPHCFLQWLWWPQHQPSQEKVG